MDELALLVQERALRDLVHRYADAVSRQDPAAAAELFVPDGEWVIPGYASLRGRAEISDYLDALLDSWESIVHALLSGRVELDPSQPNRATGRWYISELGRMRRGDAVTFAGAYDDTYVRDEDTWRFARREYTSMVRFGEPAPPPSR